MEIDTTISSKPCAVFVANRGFALTNSRLPLIRYLLKAGWSVVVVTADDDYSRQLVSEGVVLEPVVFNRGGVSLNLDIRALISLFRIYSRYSPKLIHHFHAKPVIFGSIAARLASSGQAIVVNTITGLGYAFSKGGVLRWIASLGYRLALPWSAATIFQNPDDRNLFVVKRWVLEARARLIISSGVDTIRFNSPASNQKFSHPRILMVGRLLRQKGVGELIEAAQIVKQNFPETRFQIAGEREPDHPDAFPGDILDDAVNKGIIEDLGYITNLNEVLPLSYLFVFPSFYREGVPRVVLEAAACGVPTVAADVPGSREAVLNGITGYLVKPEDSRALAERIEKLLKDKGLRKIMGESARNMAVSQFDINVITQQQLGIYQDVGLRIM